MTRFLICILSGLFLTGCATASLKPEEKFNYDPQAVLGKQWQWVSTTTPVEAVSVKRPEDYTILLKNDGMVYVRFDCNRGRGTFEISRGKLSFGPLMSTRAACHPDSLDFRFSRDLQRVAVFFTQNNYLYLELPYDSGTMKFRPAETD